MSDPSHASHERTFSFGTFRLFPAKQLLLEDGTPVRLGSRAFEILAALVERPGEVIGKNEIIGRVWPDTVVEEDNLKFQIAALRRALGDGQPGRRYVANVSGRGYRFVAPVSFSEPEQPSEQTKPVPVGVHNLPVSRSRVVGRAHVIDTLLDRLSRRRFVTIVGAGEIGKTTVALAVAEALLPTYEDGVRFVDLAPVRDQQFVSSAFGVVLGLSIDPENAATQLVDLLRDKRMLIVLDSCEHVIDAATSLAEQLVAGVPGVHILATSREPLRAKGERVHRLQPLDVPPDPLELTAAEALAYPAVQLFVERAAAILDGFELSDADAPTVSAICGKLGGIALAIELAAARVDAFGIQQLELLLDDRFRILDQGRRTAQPRHQSLAAALDWSYEFLTEIERAVLCRLSVFAGPFSFASAVAVAGADDIDVVQALGNLVAKSLISADVGDAVVHYRLLDTTRAYAIQKLAESGDLEECSRRHAQHHLDWFKRAEAEWGKRPFAEWLKDHGRRIDDARAALNWAFSASGDTSVGIALTVASTPLWLLMSLLHECGERLERALGSFSAQPTPDEREELKLRMALDLVLLHIARPMPADADHWMKSLSLGKKLGDLGAQGHTLNYWACYCLYVGSFREALAVGEKCTAVAAKSDNGWILIAGSVMAANALHYTGDHAEALSRIEPFVKQDAVPNHVAGFGERLSARQLSSAILWLQGLPDQAIASIRNTVDEAEAFGNPLMLSNMLAQSACPIAIEIGDLAEAERLIEMLLECSAKTALNTWNALGHCLQGSLLLARGDFAGLALLKNALSWLREANFFFRYAISLGALAQGLGAAGRTAEAHAAIDEALERVDHNGERWCLPELLRIKGEILHSGGSEIEAVESCFLRAMEMARRQQALSWELRAATSLAELWDQEDKTAQASELLSDVYDRFSEGFDTHDLKKARALLDMLRKAHLQPHNL